ncbi:MAG: adenylate kinase [Candidatus Micrarchaeota archaeon]|nr:MAG: adenylate kinase [Candidatus Micrarchaeota archaeon]
MYRRALLLGMQGVGKTSLVNGIKKYKAVNIGDLMFEYLKDKYKLSKKDELRYLKTDAIIEARFYALDKINEMQENLVIDTHLYSIKGGYRYIPNFNKEEFDRLKNLVAIIYIDASPEEIYNRRLNDKSRQREASSVYDIALERDMHIAMLASVSNISRLPVYILQNHDNKLNESIERLNNLLEEIFNDSNARG